MRTLILRTMLLVGAMLGTLSASAQSGAVSSPTRANALAGALPGATTAATSQPTRFATDVAFTYSPEYARVTYQHCACFWMNGFSVDGSTHFYGNLALAAQLSEGVSSGVGPNVDVHKLSFLAGPRYTFSLRGGGESRTGSHAFIESLFGLGHAYKGVFPASGGVTSSATSAAIQMGGGYDIGVSDRLGLRLFEADWVHTSFPNGAANVQNDLRIAIGFRLKLR